MRLKQLYFKYIAAIIVFSSINFIIHRENSIHIEIVWDYDHVQDMNTLSYKSNQMSVVDSDPINHTKHPNVSFDDSKEM